MGAANDDTQSGQVGWFGLATIWFGGMISVPALLIGSTLVAGLSFAGVVALGLIAFAIVASSMALLGAKAVQRRSDTVGLAASAFGTEGTRWVIGIVIGVPMVGWFGVQTAIAAKSLVHIASLTFGMNIPAPLASMVLGLVMTMTAVLGFGSLKWLNYLAVPCKVFLVAFGVGMALWNHGVAPVLSYRPDPAHALDPLSAIGLAIGFVAMAMVIAPDYARQARTPRDAALGCVLGLLPAATLLAASGAILAITQHTYDIVEIYARFGWPLLALTVLIIATWSTNVINVYSAGRALNGMLAAGERWRPWTTLAAGLFGAVLAAGGLLDRLTGFLSLLTLTVTPIAGVMIAALWLVPRPDDSKRFRWTGIAAWLIASFTMIIWDHPLRNLLGPVLAAAIYTVLARRSPDVEVQEVR